MTETDARERYLDSQRRYNESPKGKARRQRYEDKHPERATFRLGGARDRDRDVKGF